jgi:hypothetical protein
VPDKVRKEWENMVMEMVFETEAIQAQFRIYNSTRPQLLNHLSTLLVSLNALGSLIVLLNDAA